MKKITTKNIKKVVKNDNELEMLARLVTNGFERMDKRFEQVDKKFEQVDKRFESLESRMESGFFSINQTLSDHTKRLDKIERKQAGILTSLDETVHRSEFKVLLSRVDSLEKKVLKK